MNDWKLSQIFGDQQPGDKVHDIDVISAIDFEANGDFLAVGDHGGRVVLFEKSHQKHAQIYSRSELEKMDSATFAVLFRPTYFYKTEFQSHSMEFDYLNSLEIGEKIKKLRWHASSSIASLFILSTNDRTVKLWKISENKAKKVKEKDKIVRVSSESSFLAEMSSATTELNELSVSNGYHTEWIAKRRRSSTSIWGDTPTTMPYIGENVSAKCRRTYSQAHEYNINSISNNSDCETFISADDLRINLWNLEVSNQCFNIVDRKPPDMEDLVGDLLCDHSLGDNVGGVPSLCLPPISLLQF